MKCPSMLDNFMKPSIFPFLNNSQIIKLIAGSLMASIGLVYNDYSILVGSMLVSPLGEPSQALSLSINYGKYDNILYILMSMVIMIAVGFSIGYMMSYFNHKKNLFSLPTQSMEKLNSDEFLFTNFILGCIAGFVGTYANIHNEKVAITGLSIMVSILPPIVNTGMYYHIASLESGELKEKYHRSGLNSLKIALMNILGIACFSLIGFYFFC